VRKLKRHVYTGFQPLLSIAQEVIQCRDKKRYNCIHPLYRADQSLAMFSQDLGIGIIISFLGSLLLLFHYEHNA
jgi:hypothetical protein